MEFKHFSHNHGLVFHQMPQGAQIQCSGCHCPGTGPVYACWRCSFFLHDQCFRANRSLKHPSHPLHPLTLTPYPTYPSNSFYCNSCTLIGSGFSYSCSECDFDLHVHCAHSPIPNQAIPCTHPNPNPNPSPIPSFSPPTSAPAAASPSVHSPVPAKPAPEPEPPVGFPTGKDRETTHFSHPHRLKLTEVQEKDGKKCSGCEYIITGPVYTCVDPDCGVDFNLHKKCFELPREVRHKSHLDHALTLLPSPPYQDGDGFACNACLQKGSAFVYHCGACSFDLHVECVRWPEKVQRDDHKHALSLFYAPPVPPKKDGEEAAAEEKVTFVCDVCHHGVHEMAWTYYCHECDFGTHLDCVVSKVQPPVDKQEDADDAAAAAAIQEAQMKLALLQLLVNGGGPIEFTFS